MNENHRIEVGGVALSRQQLLVGAGSLLGCAALSQVAPVTALAAPGDKFTVIKEGFSSLPLSTVSIDPTEMSLNDATSYSATGELEVVSDVFSQYDARVPKALITRHDVKGSYDVPGTFKARWDNIGFDSDGAALSADLTLDQVRLYDTAVYQPRTDMPPGIMEFDGSSVLGAQTALVACSGGIRLTNDLPAHVHFRPGKFVMTWRFTRPDGSPMRGMLNFCMRDVDMFTSQAPDFPEGFRLISGFGDKVWLAPNAIIDANPATGVIATTNRSDTFDDPDTEISQVFMLASSEFSFEWQGCKAETGLFMKVKLSKGRGGVSKAAKHIEWA